MECIYEPPQSATADSLQLERGTEEEQRADYIAELLGYDWSHDTDHGERLHAGTIESWHSCAGSPDCKTL